MDKEALKEHLKELGYDVSDGTLEEFMEYLEKNPIDPIEPKTEQKPKSKWKSKLKSKSKSKRRHFAMQYRGTNQEDEETQWTNRLRSLQSKAQRLDQELRECAKLGEIRYQVSGPPLYRFNYDHMKDPYPVLEREAGGRGFIRPPKSAAARNRYPIYRRDLCFPPPDFVQHLRESERRPKPYVPDKYNRQDDLRFRLRERMVYSHPDYGYA